MPLIETARRMVNHASQKLRTRSMAMRLTRVQQGLLVLLLAAPLLGLLGVIAAEVVPDGRIANHLIEGQRDGLFNEDRTRPTTPLGTRSPNGAECMAFSLGLGDQPERNHVTTAIVSPAYRGWCQGLDRQLRVYEATGELRPGFDYFRYWHGYAVITRPALGLLGVAGTRWIAFALLAGAVSAMGFAVARALGWAAAAILVAPSILTTDTIIGGLTADGAIGIAAAWAGGWMAFTLTSRRTDWRTAALIAALAGALSAYVDLMTSIPGAYALTVVGAALGVIAANGSAALREGWRTVAAAAAGWVLGLIWMWGSKWVIAAITVGVDDVVDNVRSQIEFRLSAERVDPSRTRGLLDNLDAWWGNPLTPLVVPGIMAVLVIAAVRRRPSPKAVSGTAVCAAIAAVPVLGWYLVLNNHSQIHWFLVYRSLAMAFGAVAALLYVGLTAAVARPAGATGSGVDEELPAVPTTEPRTAETPGVTAGASTR